MARIELRHCDIVLRDGSRGTAEVDDASIMDGNTTLNITDTVVVGNRTVVPVGAHFRVTGVDQKYLVTAQNSNKVWTVTVDATSGNFTITFNGQTTASIAEGALASAVQTALVALSNVASGDLVVSGSAGGPFTIEAKQVYAGLSSPVLTVSDVDLMGGGATVGVVTTQPGAETWQLTFTPPLVSGDLPVDMDPITILPRELTIKIGDGDLRYTERDEFNYDLDRGELDTVRQGNDVPMEVVSNFVYESITTGAGEDIAPMDAIKRRGSASDWISAAEDECEPYAVDLLVIHTPPCGTAEKEFTLFPDLRSEQREVNFKESNIQITGRCNVVEPVTWRGEETDEPA
jgi:hypothetical protein